MKFYLKMVNVTNVNPIQPNRMIIHASLKFVISFLYLQLLEIVKNVPTMFRKRILENVQLQLLVLRMKF